MALEWQAISRTYERFSGAQHMFSKLTTQGRVWILLIGWILFTTLYVADMFDLSDDIVWPTVAGQLATVAPDSAEEQKPHAFVPDVLLYSSDVGPLPLRLGSDSSTLFSIPFARSDTPLYQRHSVYRI